MKKDVRFLSLNMKILFTFLRHDNMWWTDKTDNLQINGETKAEKDVENLWAYANNRQIDLFEDTKLFHIAILSLLNHFFNLIRCLTFIHFNVSRTVGNKYKKYINVSLLCCNNFILYLFQSFSGAAVSEQSLVRTRGGNLAGSGHFIHFSCSLVSLLFNFHSIEINTKWYYYWNLWLTF